MNLAALNGASRPNVARMALESAFEPSMTNRRGRRIKPALDEIVDQRLQTAAFSVAPSIAPSGCFSPFASTPTAATRVTSSPMWMPSI